MTLRKSPKFGHHANGNGGFFNTPLRFWTALSAMVAAFILFVTYQSSTPALNEVTKNVSRSNSKPMASIAVTLEDLERSAAVVPPPPPSKTVAKMTNAEKVAKRDAAAAAAVQTEDEDVGDEEETTEAENSAAVSDLMSNEQYPTYDLPSGGTQLREVQDEVNAGDIPEAKESDAAEEQSNKEFTVNDDDIFEDAEAYKRAPFISSMPESSSLRYREIVLQHERYYRTHPSRLYVPRLKKTVKLSIAQFAERFMKTSQPVIIPFEAMRHLGFTTKSYTLDEMLQLYPNYKRTFTYKYGSPGPGELDLGPAVWALKQGDALRKTATGRNFPRNTKISLDKLSRLGVQNPPYIIPGTPMLAPSLWFATVSSSTKLHSDCCDNYAMMISGTKRWTVAPPNEARILTPACFGGLCWVKKLEHPDEHAKGSKEQELAERLQKVTFDLRPGEMLYLPTGWFHHVENVGPTVMINFWTRGGAGFLKALDGSLLKTIADLQKEEHAQKSRL